MAADTEIEINESRYDSLADLVVSRFHEAAASRAGERSYSGRTIEDWLDSAYDAYMKRGDNEHFNLTRIKVGALHAKVKDMVINAVDAPFVIKPTPIPTLSKEQQDQVTRTVEDLLGEHLIRAGMVVIDEEGNSWPDFSSIMLPDGVHIVPSVREWLRDQGVKQKRSMEIEATTIAEKAAGHATTVMQDQMLEGGWREAYLDSLFDIFLYGTGVIRCEQRRVQSLKWRGESLKESTEDSVTWRHVPIANCYPSADSESANEGTYFIERGAMRKQDLFAAVQIDWVKADRVREAYEAAQENFHWLSGGDSEIRTRWGDDSLIDVLIHEGTVRGDVLLDWFDEDEDGHNGIKPDEFYDVEAWVLAGITIGARILKYPNGMRSYFSANFQRAGRNFWGVGAAMTLADLECRLNGLFEDLYENVNLTVAPPIFYNAALFERADDITLAKRARIPFNPDPTGAPNAAPFSQVQIDGKYGQLVELINWMYRLADDESGIPGLLSGNTDLMGGEATFRGMKMLAASANIMIKDAFLNIDQTLIQPAMRYLWRWNMLNSDDPSIKADVSVVARGAAGLMQQEIADAERSDILPILMQLIPAAGLQPEEQARIMNYLIRETMKQGGLPADSLVRDSSAIAEQLGIVQSLQPATPMPTIGADQNTGGLNVS